MICERLLDRPVAESGIEPSALSINPKSLTTPNFRPYADVNALSIYFLSDQTNCSLLIFRTLQWYEFWLSRAPKDTGTQHENSLCSLHTCLLLTCRLDVPARALLKSSAAKAQTSVT